MKRYHFECQTRPDSSMLKRMAEYDGQIAVENSEVNRNKLVAELPQAAVLYLQSTRNTPDELEILIKSSGRYLLHKIRVIKLMNYTVDDIFEKKLYFLIPFHILVYKKHFSEYNKDKEKLLELQKIYEDILDRLELLEKKDILSAYSTYSILVMTRKILDHVTVKYGCVKERIGNVMGGKILDYPGRKEYWAAKSEGRRELCISLLKDGIISLSEAAKRLGMKEEEIKMYM